MAVNPENHAKAQWYLDNHAKLTPKQFKDALRYKWYRINTLYKVKNKDGKVVVFKCNPEQTHFYKNEVNRNIVLKSRKLGFTTYKLIDKLDECLFTANYKAGFICQTMALAREAFREKVRFAYERITRKQKRALKAIGKPVPETKTDTTNTYVFANDSSIVVSTAFRGSTPDSVHISELGKIAADNPKMANEIKSGTIEAVAEEGEVTIESTAEGDQGMFFNYCQTAKKKKDDGKRLSILDFKFFFYSWCNGQDNKLYGPPIEDGEEYPEEYHTAEETGNVDRYYAEVNPELIDYFDRTEIDIGKKLSQARRAWYSSKYESLDEDVFKENPATPEEAFKKIVEGAIYGKQVKAVVDEGRLIAGDKFPDNKAEVHTAWDIGVRDSAAIWFFKVVGEEIHVIDYYEKANESLQFLAGILNEKAEENNWDYGYHYGPHDIKHRQFANRAKTISDIAAEGMEIDGTGQIYKLYFTALDQASIQAGIENVRKCMKKCYFHKENTDLGFKRIRNYKRKKAPDGEGFLSQPDHDISSHGADAFRYMVQGLFGENSPIMTNFTF